MGSSLQGIHISFVYRWRIKLYHSNAIHGFLNFLIRLRESSTYLLCSLYTKLHATKLDKNNLRTYLEEWELSLDFEFVILIILEFFWFWSIPIYSWYSF